MILPAFFRVIFRVIFQHKMLCFNTNLVLLCHIPYDTKSAKIRAKHAFA